MSFLIYRGKGYLVMLAAIAGWGIIRCLRNQVLIYFFVPSTPVKGFALDMLAVLAMAGINYVLTKHFCKPREYTKRDPDGVEYTVVVKDDSHLYGIPNRVWTWVILIGGTALMIYRNFFFLR